MTMEVTVNLFFPLLISFTSATAICLQYNLMTRRIEVDTFVVIRNTDLASLSTIENYDSFKLNSNLKINYNKFCIEECCA